MTHRTEDDDLLASQFSRLDFADEPSMRTTAHDDARRGRRHLVRRRVIAAVAGGSGIAVIAAATAVLLPGGQLGVGDLGRDTTVLAPPPPPAEDVASAGDGYEYPLTRTTLLEAAQEHLDPDGEHLPTSLAEVQNVQSGGLAGGAVRSVGTKLDWTVPGESGLGLVQVEITTPGYADAEDYALEGFTAAFGCDLETDACAEQLLPDTDLRVWVAEDTADVDLGVILERADGSLVGLAAHDLFWNNSTVPVSEVAITLDQAFAFVADPDLVVDTEELASTRSAFDENGAGPESESERPVPDSSE